MDIESQFHQLQSNRWQIRIAGNPTISNTDFNHYYFHQGVGVFSGPASQFSSPHVNVLKKQDKSKAKLRLNNILRLVRGINEICEYRNVYPSSGEMTHINSDGSHEKIDGLTDSYDIDLFFEELNNPFDNDITSLIQEIGVVESKENDYFNLLVINPLLREAVTLFMLSEENTLYLLINTYKIMENIKNEFNLKANNGKLVKRDDSSIDDNLFNLVNTLYGHSRYINSKAASGYLSRHGETNFEPPKEWPTIKEVREDLIKVIRFWLDHECFLNYERRYYEDTDMKNN